MKKTKELFLVVMACLLLVSAISGCATEGTQATEEQTHDPVSTEGKVEETTPVLQLQDTEFNVEVADFDPEEIVFTDVPGMPTQDFVLAFQEVRGDEELDVKVQNPDQLTMDALFAIYDFVQENDVKPVRYFTPEVQQAVQDLLPDGVSVDVLHMTEFVQVLPETKEETLSAEVKVIIDADYRPGQLVIVMIGDRDGCEKPEDISWTPLKAAVTETGTIEFVVPEELVERLQGKNTLVNVLTDRVGSRGGVLRVEDGEVVIIYPSKTADDLNVIDIPEGLDGTVLPEEFEVRQVNVTDTIQAEIDSFRLHRGEGKSFISFFPEDVKDAAALLMQQGQDLDSLIAYEMMNVDCVNYDYTYGDVLARIKFATPFKDGQNLVVVLGVDNGNASDEGHQLQWTALRTEVVDGYVNITFAQSALLAMEKAPALLMVLSEPMAD